MDTQFWVQMIAYSVSVGCIYGGVAARLRSLEKKVDKHNHLVERMYQVEGCIELLKERIDHAE